MNNCSSSCHLPLISLNIDHKQTLNDKKIVTSFSSSRFDRTLTDCVQSRNSKNIVELNEIFSIDSPPAKFPFKHDTDTASISVSDLEVTNNLYINLPVFLISPVIRMSCIFHLHIFHL